MENDEAMNISAAPDVRISKRFMEDTTTLQSFVDWVALQAREYPENPLEAPAHGVRGKDEKRVIVAGRGRTR